MRRAAGLRLWLLCGAVPGGAFSGRPAGRTALGAEGLLVGAADVVAEVQAGDGVAVGDGRDQAEPGPGDGVPDGVHDRFSCRSFFFAP
ncbi:hypothetical protein [Streptomyces sp. NPDC005969]|uniref:hypothetical protein n=1 Tax=Streptomyces sp. NPDC005969 TaxID=3156722 RepID=UPI0033F5D547